MKESKVVLLKGEKSKDENYILLLRSYKRKNIVDGNISHIEKKKKERKHHQPKMVYPTQLFFKNERENFLTQATYVGICCPTICTEKILKDVLQKEGKLYISETQICLEYCW